ncbi:MAG TPA: glycosyltransferase family 39 protein [Luteibacter sp.]|uniref:ArnT family glycosyltransferase n=1 Tax=Luteibacter sp. TaxID=1886636 RepID=UPI002CC768B1|nr:glycosyltransferase family 39 protein [Luteibacter sp.]HVI53786.1 glycosyltransferase family 39 protein [Luteibacter sp.]
MPNADLLTTWLVRHPWTWILVFALVAAMLPAVPIDETRYLTIAWELHRSGDLIGLTLNGQPYLDKPPLLFWLVDAMWFLLGQSLWAARMVAVAFAAGTIAIVASIERVLGGDDGTRSPVAAWILLPFILFDTFSGSVMFDVPLCFFVTCSLLAVALWVRERRVLAAVLLFASAALGMLMKGPVVFVHLVGPLLLIAWWNYRRLPHPWRSVAMMVGVLLLACLPLAWWAADAAARMAQAPVLDTLMHQAFGRVSESFAHRRAPWWYLIWLPLFLLPWSAWIRWRPFARGARRVTATTMGRFGLAASLPALVLFSLISGKQLHYLLPLLPGLALCLAAIVRLEPATIDHRRPRIAIPIVALACAWPVARMVSGLGDTVQLPAALVAFALLGVAIVVTGRVFRERDRLAVTAIASACIVAALVLQLGVFLHLSPNADDLASTVHELQRRGVPVIALEGEPGMIGFLTRLPSPLPVVAPANAAAWATAHPDGFALIHGGKNIVPAGTRVAVKLADGWEGLVPASTVGRGAY